MPRRFFLFVIALLALAALYTIASAWITTARIGRLHAAGNATAQSQQVLSALHAFATASVDIESGARGFALTGNEAYLQPFEAARRQAPLRLDELRDLLRDDPAQLARVERLTPLLAERISISEHGIAQKRSAAGEPFVLRFGSRGRETSEEIRRVVEDIDTEERHALALRKNAWHEELERARTAEAVSALSSLTLITLSLWALLRLRRAEASAPLHAQAEAGAAPPSAPAPALPSAPPPADYETLVDETLRRAAMLQASHPSGSSERARIESLREAIEAVRCGIAPTEALAVLERLGLALALSALASSVRARECCAVRESIDTGPLKLSAPHATLLFRAADWALAVLCAQCDGGEIGVGLATDGAQVVLRVESAARGLAPMSEEMESRAAKLAQQVHASGGLWQWIGGDAGQGLTASVPALAQLQPETSDAGPPMA